MFRLSRFVVLAVLIIGFPFLTGCPDLETVIGLWHQANMTPELKQYLSQILSTIQHFDIVCVDTSRLHQAVLSGHQIALPFTVPGGKTISVSVHLTPFAMVTPSSGLANTTYAHNLAGGLNPGGIYNITSTSFAGSYYQNQGMSSVVESLADLLERNGIDDVTIIRIVTNLCGGVSAQQTGSGSGAYITYSDDDVHFNFEDEQSSPGDGPDGMSLSIANTDLRDLLSEVMAFDIGNHVQKVDEVETAGISLGWIVGVTVGTTIELSRWCQHWRRRAACESKYEDFVKNILMKVNTFVFQDPYLHDYYKFAYVLDSIRFCNVGNSCPKTLDAEKYLDATHNDPTPHNDADINLFFVRRDLWWDTVGIATMYGFHNDPPLINHAIVQATGTTKYKSTISAAAKTAHHEIGHLYGCEPDDSYYEHPDGSSHTRWRDGIMGAYGGKTTNYTRPCVEDIAEMLEFYLGASP